MVAKVFETSSTLNRLPDDCTRRSIKERWGRERVADEANVCVTLHLDSKNSRVSRRAVKYQSRCRDQRGWTKDDGVTRDSLERRANAKTISTSLAEV